MYPDLTQQLLQLVEMQRRQTEALDRMAKAIEAQTMAINALAASNEGIVNAMMEMLDSQAVDEPEELGAVPAVGASFDDPEPQTL